MKYQSTQYHNLQTIENNPPKIGQWVKMDSGIRGQYLGKTNSGAIVIRWQNGNFGTVADTKSNHYLRRFAVVNGSK